MSLGSFSAPENEYIKGSFSLRQRMNKIWDLGKVEFSLARFFLKRNE